MGELDFDDEDDWVRPVRLVTHLDCMDGSACAVIFKHVHPDAEVVFVRPHEADDVMDRGSFSTIFADVCPKYCLPHETILDHHATSFKKLHGEFNGRLDTGMCGAKLLLQHLDASISDRKGLFTAFCDVVDDYDRWILRNSSSKDLARLHQFMRQESFVSEMIRFIRDVDPMVYRPIPSKWTEVLDILERNEREYAEQMAATAWLTSIGDHPAAACLAEDCINEVREAMFRMYPDVNYAVIVSLREGKASLRSRTPEYNCAEIAMEMGGGGHPCAAGFPLSEAFMAEVRALV